MAGGVHIDACRKKRIITKVGIEVETLEQLQIALDSGANVIMLDNMNNEQLQQAHKIRVNHERKIQSFGSQWEYDQRTYFGNRRYRCGYCFYRSLIHQALGRPFTKIKVLVLFSSVFSVCHL